MDIHSTFYWAYDYLSMLGLQLIYVSNLSLVLDSSIGLSGVGGIQSAGDSVPETLWVRRGRQRVSFRLKNRLPVPMH